MVTVRRKVRALAVLTYAGRPQAADRVRVICAPCPGSLRASSWPPWARASSAGTARPIPLPETGAAPHPRQNRSKVLGSSSAGMSAPGVGDPESGLSPGRAGLHGDPAAGGGELQRVGEQVGMSWCSRPGSARTATLVSRRSSVMPTASNRPARLSAALAVISARSCWLRPAARPRRRRPQGSPAHRSRRGLRSAPPGRCAPSGPSPGSPR